MGRTTIRRGAGKRRVDGKSLRLADEVRYIQRRAADHDGRVVTVGQLVLFSTETGDAWLLEGVPGAQRSSDEKSKSPGERQGSKGIGVRGLGGEARPAIERPNRETVPTEKNRAHDPRACAITGAR